MKKIQAYAILMIFIVAIGLIYIKNHETTDNDKNEYVSWELQCINEYEESKEYYVFVDIPQHKLFLYNGGDLVKEYNISTGTNETPSPVGIFKITSKANWGKGFGGTWMGFNVPWGKYGLHGTLSPNSIGWNSSKGCIRMYNRDAKELSQIIGCGTYVEIYGGIEGAVGSSLRVLTPGDRGADVMEVQRRLKKLGYYQGTPDGIYGKAMDNAVLKFQKDHKIRTDKKIGTKMYELLGIIPFE